jgi:hypothetical protein
LDVSDTRCRDCLLSPSHCQLAGGLRLLGVGCANEIRTWVDRDRPHDRHRMVLLGHWKRSTRFTEREQF